MVKLQVLIKIMKNYKQEITIKFYKNINNQEVSRYVLIEIVKVKINRKVH